MTVLEFANQKLKEAGISNYIIQPVLQKVRPNTKLQFGDSADYFFTANFFSESVIMGKVSAINDVFAITPQITESAIYKFRAFKGQVTIENSGASTLFVELLRVNSVTDQELINNQ